MTDFPYHDPIEAPELTLRDVLVTVATALGALLIAALPYVLR